MIKKLALVLALGACAWSPAHAQKIHLNGDDGHVRGPLVVEGPLTLAGPPTALNQASQKGYVDTEKARAQAAENAASAAAAAAQTTADAALPASGFSAQAIAGFGFLTNATLPINGVTAGGNCTVVSQKVNCPAGGGGASLPATTLPLAGNGSGGAVGYDPATFSYPQPDTAGSPYAGSSTIGAALRDSLHLNIAAMAGIHMDGVTDDCAQWNAAVAQVNAYYAANHVILPIKIPAGHGRLYINCATTTKFATATPGSIIGDDPAGSIIQFGPLLNGAFARWNANTLGSPNWSNIPGVVSWSTASMGPRVVGVTFAGDQSSTNPQTALEFDDQEKQVFVSDVNCYQLTGSCIRTGQLVSSTHCSNISESRFQFIRAIQTGSFLGTTGGYPTYDIWSQWDGVGGCDGNNQIDFLVMRSTRINGPAGLWVHSTSLGTGARQLRFYGLEVEQSLGWGIIVGGTSTVTDAGPVSMQCLYCVANGGALGGVLVNSPPSTAFGNVGAGVQFGHFVSLENGVEAPNVEIDSGHGSSFDIDTWTPGYTQWSANKAGVTAGTHVTVNTNLWSANAGGTTGTTPPSGTTVGQTSNDGSITWTLLSTKACAFCVGLHDPSNIAGNVKMNGDGAESNDGWQPVYLDPSLPDNTILTHKWAAGAHTAVAGASAPIVGSLEITPVTGTVPGTGSADLLLDRVVGPTKAASVHFRGTTDGLTYGDAATITLSGTATGTLSIIAPAANGGPVTAWQVNLLNGASTFAAGLNIAADPGAADNSLKVPSTGWVQRLLAGYTPAPPVGNSYVTPGASQGGSTQHLEHAIGSTAGAATNFETWDNGAVVSTDYVLGEVGGGAGVHLRLWAAGFTATPAYDLDPATGILTLAAGTLLRASPSGSANDLEVANTAWVRAYVASIPAISSVVAGSGIAVSTVAGAATVSHAVPAGASATTYCDSTHFPIVTTDAFGHVTGVTCTVLPAAGATYASQVTTGSCTLAPAPANGSADWSTSIASQTCIYSTLNDGTHPPRTHMAFTIVFTPSFTSTAWAASTAYTSGTKRVNGSNVYTETVASCTSASSGGPTGTGTAITDGTCSWNYVAPGVSGNMQFGYTGAPKAANNGLTDAIMATSPWSGTPSALGFGASFTAVSFVTNPNAQFLNLQMFKTGTNLSLSNVTAYAAANAYTMSGSGDYISQ